MAAFAVLIEAVLPSYLYSALVGFCAAVSEKYLFIACYPTQLFCKIRLNCGVVVIGVVLVGLGYLVYEFRHEILKLFRKVFRRFH